MRKISTALLIILILVVPLLAFAEGNVTADRTISFEESSYVVYAGKAQKIVVTVENILDSAPKQTQLVWTSSDPDIAMVNAGGQVTGKKAGKVTITAAAKDNEAVSASVEAEVRVPVQSVKINEKNVTVAVGSKEEAAKTQLTVSIKPEDAYFQTGVWTSSNEEIAEVNENGVVEGHKPGTVTISFTSDDPTATRKTQIQVKVNQAVEKIELSDVMLSVDKGKNATIKAEILPKEASNKKVTWTSSNENVAAVNGTGAVTAKGLGKAIITCTASDGSEVKAECEVTVISMVKAIKPVGKNKLVVFQDQTGKADIDINPKDATDKTVVWNSSDPSIATVDNSGNVTGRRAGTCKISAMSVDGSNKKAEFNVTVEPKNPITLESLGFGIFQPNLLGFTVKNHCKTMKIVNFDFNLTVHSWGISQTSSYNLGKNTAVGPGQKKTIKRNLYGVAGATGVDVTITGVYFSDGSYYTIPSGSLESWSFTR